MRELSAKLTEGETLDGSVDMLAYTAENAVDNSEDSHTKVSVPTVSYFCGSAFAGGMLDLLYFSYSLPPSKIKDFCHLPHQREA